MDPQERNAILEEAAKEAEKLNKIQIRRTKPPRYAVGDRTSAQIAAAIRSLKGK